ncbi:DUF1326 domain-containing protein [Halomonas sp. HAL1]|uniref:DUF1326 domain-containing protein n=1 Tax=Halomonas sp. HAL1 TaxID=550984 RepID=UPI00022D2F2F|nr:DUF1326 domain-containing protein [Halomonas sp. HAL1]EHA16800.1 hypothetical protein HAL1_03467 [Halomonas sp. HAL1]WKV94657.1 DUF1326 domain-containing protein [Halomonas sp. HAL1]
MINLKLIVDDGLSTQTIACACQRLSWHITQGQFEAVDLGDRKVVITLHSPGPMVEGTIC